MAGRCWIWQSGTLRVLPGRRGRETWIGRAGRAMARPATTLADRNARVPDVRRVLRRRVCRPHAATAPDGVRRPAMDRRARASLSSARALGDGVEHRLEVGRRRRDHAQDLGGRGLLLQRLGRRALSSVALLQLLEEAGVLDGDDGLVRERLQQRDLVVGLYGSRLVSVDIAAMPMACPSRSSGRCTSRSLSDRVSSRETCLGSEQREARRAVLRRGSCGRLTETSVRRVHRACGRPHCATSGRGPPCRAVDRLVRRRRPDHQIRLLMLSRTARLHDRATPARASLATVR